MTHMSKDALESRYINLVSPKLGAEVTYATDDFFAAKERVIDDKDPVFIEDKYDDHGKWMDGWESRRKRTEGHDHCIIKMGTSGIIRAVNIDTSFFTGNYPPGASVEACLSDDEPDAETIWTTLVARTDLGPDAAHILPVEDDRPYNWLRLNIFPDGGVARLRVYGDAYCNWQAGGADTLYELSAVKNGGRIVAYNDAHYGAVWSLLCPGRGKNMGDGWETRRRREPGNDWIIIALGRAGVIEKIELDTAHFKGNYPDGFSLQAAMVDDIDDATIAAQAETWAEILPRSKLGPDSEHVAGEAAVLKAFGPVSHIRLNIYPDGGVSRFRVWGKLAGS